MLKRLSAVSRALSPTSAQSPRKPAAQPVVPVPQKQQPLSPRLKLHIAATAQPEDNQRQHHVPVVDGGGAGLVRDVLLLLDALLHRMDEIKPKKLRSIRLGGELRGLLGKAEDELGAHAATFHTYIDSPGLHIQMQNFLASLHGLVPIVDSIHSKKFLVNSFVKKSVQFAFQEISSYYSSIFTELSLAVAKATGSAAEAAVLAALSKPIDQPPVEAEEPPVDYGDAMYLLAHQYYFGHGKEKDYAEAYRLYLTAAKHAHVDAMVCAGCMIRDGRGTEADREAALQWFTRAADQGSPDGASNLGLILMDKATHVTNPHKQQELFALALVRLTQAGDRGVAAAQFAAGKLYHTKIAPCDVVKAKEWYAKASAARHAPADLALGHLFLDQDKALSAHHFQRALSCSDAISASEAANAAFLLGRIYSSGEDVAEDVPRSESFFRQAAQAGHIQACLEMARRTLHTPQEALQFLVQSNLTSATAPEDLAQAAYLKGQIFESSKFRCVTTALMHYTVAGEQGHVEGAKRAAAMLYSGVADAKKVPPNRPKAYEMYAVAARKKDRDALNALGLMHEEGAGCRLDLAKAALYFREAAALGSAHGHFNYGCLLQIGKGVDANETQAKWHFAQAAALGYAVPNHVSTGYCATHPDKLVDSNLH